MEKDAETEQRIRERAYQIWIEEGRPTAATKSTGHEPNKSSARRLTSRRSTRPAIVK